MFDAMWLNLSITGCGIAMPRAKKSIAIWPQQKVVIWVVIASMRLVGGYMFRGKWFDLMRLMWCLRTNTVASPFGHPRLCHLQVRFAIILEEVCPSSAWSRERCQAYKKPFDISFLREAERPPCIGVVVHWTMERNMVVWQLSLLNYIYWWFLHSPRLNDCHDVLRTPVNPRTCQDNMTGVHNPPPLALLWKGYFFLVCWFIH